MNTHSAIAFINNNGNAVDFARLRYILYKEPPTEEAIDSLFGDQRQDGGWAPFWHKDYSSLDATCFRLAQAEELGLDLQFEPIGYAMQFIAERQYQEGSWEEEHEVAEQAPEWVKPGHSSAKLYLTANCAFTMSMFDRLNGHSALAADFMQLRMDPEGRILSYLQTHWLTAALWQRTNVPKLAVLVLQYLASQMHTLTPSDMAWMICTMLAAGFKPSNPLMYSAVEVLRRRSCHRVDSA